MGSLPQGKLGELIWDKWAALQSHGEEAALLSSAEVLPQPDMDSTPVFKSPCYGSCTMVFAILFWNDGIRLETLKQHQLTANFCTDKIEGVFGLGVS